MSNRYYVTTLLAGVILLASPLLLLAVDSASLRAGAAKMNITPDPGELAFSTDFIRDSLFVRAIFVEDGAMCAVLVSVDAGSVRDNVLDVAIPASSASTGCPAENYIISATHTHSGSTGSIGQPGSPTSETISAAIISAVDEAKSRLAPARIGYGTAQLDLNVNRDLFNSKQEWRQEANPAGVSDKTLAVVAFVGDDAVPIGVLMNYAMHPINFYLSGVVSADFPGDAANYVEELYGKHTVALFTQGASGDQNPRLGYTAPYSTRSFRRGLPSPQLTAGPEPPRPENTTRNGFNPQAASAGRSAIPDELLEDYKKTISRVSDYSTMLGHMIGSTAIRVMSEDMQYTSTAPIWAGQQSITCPGRIRLDADNPARENVFPGYEDGPDVHINVALLRIGEVHLVGVNGEVYTNIALKLKERAPANKTVMVTLANGRANSGYIYSDDAYHHLTFQVIGSRLKPGCAEDNIVSAAIELMHRSGSIK